MIIESFVDRLFSIKDKVAVITGASRGVGLEIAKAFSLCGAKTIGLGRSAITFQDVAFTYYLCDVSDYDQLKIIFDRVESEFGRIDILINAAGITLGQESGLDSFQRFHKTLNTNLIATYNSCVLGSNIMASNGGGSIVNITSIAAFQGFPGNPAYVASKGAVTSMTKALALDFASLGIRVNCIAPGYIKTAMTEKSFVNKEKYEERLQHMMIKRWGSVDDLVGASIYLASNASAYVTGTDLVVDGGWISKGM